MVNKEKLCGVLFCACWEKEGKAFYKEKKTCMCPKPDARKREKKRKKEKAKLSKEKNKSGILYIVYVEVAQSLVATSSYFLLDLTLSCSY